MNLTYLRLYLTPKWGRFNASQLRTVAEHLLPPAFFAVGPFLVLIDLPEKWRKPEPEVALFDLNAHLRRLAEEAEQPSN